MSPQYLWERRRSIYSWINCNLALIFLSAAPCFSLFLFLPWEYYRLGLLFVLFADLCPWKKRRGRGGGGGRRLLLFLYGLAFISVCLSTVVLNNWLLHINSIWRTTDGWILYQTANWNPKANSFIKLSWCNRFCTQNNAVVLSDF